MSNATKYLVILFAINILTNNTIYAGEFDEYCNDPARFYANLRNEEKIFVTAAISEGTISASDAAKINTKADLCAMIMSSQHINKGEKLNIDAILSNEDYDLTTPENAYNAFRNYLKAGDGKNALKCTTGQASEFIRFIIIKNGESALKSMANKLWNIEKVRKNEMGATYKFITAPNSPGQHYIYFEKAYKNWQIRQF